MLLQLASGKTGFNIKNTSIYLTGAVSSGTSIVGIKSDAKMYELVDASQQDGDDGFGGAKVKKSQKPLNTDFEVLKVGLMLKLTTDHDIEQIGGGATACVIDSGNRESKFRFLIISYP